MAKRVSSSAKTKSSAKAKTATTSKPVIDPVKHFAYLATSTNDKALLKSIFDSAMLSERKGVLIVDLKNGFTLEATGSAKKIPAKSPRTFSAALKKHASLALIKGENIILELAETGRFDSDTLRDNASPLFDYVKNPKDLIFPLAESQDSWVYHPDEKNETKEPVIYFVSHDTLRPTRLQECNIGSLFLQRCAQLVGVSSTKQKGSKNDPLELVPIKDAFFKNSRCVRLPDGRVLKIGDKTISWLNCKNGKFAEGPTSKFPLGPITPDYEIKSACDGDLATIAVDLHGIFLIDVSSDPPKYVSTPVKEFERGASILLNDKIIFYQDGFEDKPSAFRIQDYEKTDNVTIVKTSERLRLTSVLKHHNLLIFAGQDHLLGFEFVPTTKKLKQVFKVTAEYGAPSIEPTPEKKYFIIFDEDEYAISLYHIDGKPKLKKTLLPDSPARGWCWHQNELYVLVQTSDDGYSIGKYIMTNDELKSLKTVSFKLKNPVTKWICVTFFHFQDGTAHIINADGMTWKLPVG